MERNSKMWRSALAMVLAICMVISFCPVAAFAAEEEINYVSLGDSMTNGYCFTGYEQGTDSNNILTGEGMYGNDAYRNLFAAWLEETTDKTVNHSKLAVSAMRAEDLNYLLGGREMPTDGWFDQVENYSGKNAAELVEIYQEAIAEADVITVDIGNFAFGPYLDQYIARMLGVLGGSLDEDEKVDLEKTLAALESREKNVIMTAYESMMDRTEYYLIEESSAVNIQDIIDVIACFGAGFLLNYKGALEQIVELNSDVEIVLVGLMNTTYGMKITGEGVDPIEIGDLMDDMINALNAYTAGLPAVMQAKGEWKNARFYYAEQPKPEFIVQVFDDMAEAGWVDDGVGLSETIVRARTIKAYNETLRPMLELAFNMQLPVITVEDVENYVFDEVCAGYGVGYQILNQFFAELEQLMGGANPANLPLIMRYINSTGDYTLAHVADWVVGVFSPEITKEISIAIYAAIEASLVDSIDNMEISLEGLLGIAGNPLDALGEVPEALLGTPSPKTIRDELHGWFTGSETALAMCKVFAVLKVGDGMSVHPTPKCHNEIADSVIKAFQDKNDADVLSFTWNETGEGYIVSNCDESATGEVIIPATYKGLPVTGIGDSAFQNCFGISSIAIPESVTSIGYSAFYGCIDLNKVIYCGTQEQWNAISLGEGNEDLTAAVIQFHSYENSICTICGQLESGASAFTLTVSEGPVYRGDTVNVTVSVSKTEHCVTGGFLFDFDTDIFEYVSGETLASGFSAAGISTANGKIAGYFMDGDETLAGEIFQITLRVKEDATFTEHTISGTASLSVKVDDLREENHCGIYGTAVSVVCRHNFGDWINIDQTWHKHICTICSFEETTYIEYSVVFQYADGTVISTVTYHYGDEIEAPQPARQKPNSYFTGWDKEIGVCTGDVVYTAIFVEYVPGDMDGNGEMEYDDAVYLLLSLMFGEENYPLSNAPADINGDGTISQEDAIYLLLHNLFGEEFYPLKEQE